MEPISLRFLASHSFAHSREELNQILEAFQKEHKLPPKLVVEGIAIDTSINANGWRVLPTDLENIAQQLTNALYMKNHSDKVEDIIGRVEAAWVDKKENGEPIVKYRATVVDEDIIKKILLGLIQYDSITLESHRLYCSRCYERYLQTKNEQDLRSAEYPDISVPHRCGSRELIVADPRVVELSIVAFPAYQDTRLYPVGFSAAMNIFISSKRPNNTVYESSTPSPREYEGDSPASGESKSMSFEAKKKEDDLTSTDEPLKTGKVSVGPQHSYEDFLEGLGKIAQTLEKALESYLVKLEATNKNLSAVADRLEKVVGGAEKAKKKAKVIVLKTKRGRIVRAEEEEEEPEDEPEEEEEEVEVEEAPRVRREEEEEDEARRRREEIRKRLEEIKKKIEEAKMKEASAATGKGITTPKQEGDILATSDELEQPEWFKEMLKAAANPESQRPKGLFRFAA